jgi:hypothetical protein
MALMQKIAPSLLIALILALFALHCSKQPNLPPPSDPIHSFANHGPIPSLRERIGVKNVLVLNYLKGIDENTAYRFYHPGPERIDRVLGAIESFPPFIRKNLEESVTGIYFIQDFASSGFTEWVEGPDRSIMSFIVLNPAVFDRTVSELITYRENSCFRRDPRRSVSIEMGTDPAIDYILLHEAVHAADYTHRINDYVDEGSRILQMGRPRLAVFMDNYWRGSEEVVSEYDFALRKRITFYGFGGGPLLDINEADALYGALVKSPFPSLYGSRLRSEDLAELLSVYHISVHRKRGYRIDLIENGTTRKSYEPLRSEALRERFKDLKLFYRN